MPPVNLTNLAPFLQESLKLQKSLSSFAANGLVISSDWLIEDRTFRASDCQSGAFPQPGALGLIMSGGGFLLIVFRLKCSPDQEQRGPTPSCPRFSVAEERHA